MESGFLDRNGARLKEGRAVKLFGQRGRVCWNNGAWGIGFTDTIDWNKVESEVKIRTGNAPRFCRCDNFVSFWELMWNFNNESKFIDVLAIADD